MVGRFLSLTSMGILLALAGGLQAGTMSVADVGSSTGGGSTLDAGISTGGGFASGDGLGGGFSSDGFGDGGFSGGGGTTLGGFSGDGFSSGGMFSDTGWDSGYDSYDPVSGNIDLATAGTSGDDYGVWSNDLVSGSSYDPEPWSDSSWITDDAMGSPWQSGELDPADLATSPWNDDPYGFDPANHDPFAPEPMTPAQQEFSDYLAWRENQPASPYTENGEYDPWYERELGRIYDLHGTAPPDFSQDYTTFEEMEAARAEDHAEKGWLQAGAEWLGGAATSLVAVDYRDYGWLTTTMVDEQQRYTEMREWLQANPDYRMSQEEWSNYVAIEQNYHDLYGRQRDLVIGGELSVVKNFVLPPVASRIVAVGEGIKDASEGNVVTGATKAVAPWAKGWVADAIPDTSLVALTREAVPGIVGQVLEEGLDNTRNGMTGAVDAWIQGDGVPSTDGAD